MAEESVGIIVNGATSRIASTQHIENALVPIRDEGGIDIAGKKVIPRLMLVGRDAAKLEPLARRFGIEDWMVDLDAALADPRYPVFFDAAVTHLRVATLERAIGAGKHIYTEKPMAPGTGVAARLIGAAEARGLKHGVVEDKHLLPGMVKLRHLVKEGLFGEIRQFRVEFGWWIFDGCTVACQRPSWNYQARGGGGLIFDMHPHWRYVIESALGRIARVVASGWTATPERVDEAGKAYRVDVEDSTSALIELESGAQGTLFASWASRVRRDEILAFQIDGAAGSAVAGAHRCHTQTMAATPALRWSPNADLHVDYSAQWEEAPDLPAVKNSYRVGWEGFLRHLIADEPFAATFKAGLRDIQFAEACQTSIAERRWVAMSEIADT